MPAVLGAVLEPANTEAVVFHYVLYNRQIFFDEAEASSCTSSNLRIDVGQIACEVAIARLSMSPRMAQIGCRARRGDRPFYRAAVHFIEATIHLIETTVHFIETVIDRLEPAIHLVETDVDCLEPVVDPIERSSNSA